MARRALLVLLALGSVTGFAAGCCGEYRHGAWGWGPPWAQHQSRLDTLAEACVRAAERVRGSAPAAPSAAPAPGTAPAP